MHYKLQLLIVFILTSAFNCLAQDIKTKKRKIDKSGYELYEYKKVNKDKVKHGLYQLYDRSSLKQNGYYQNGQKDSVWKYYGYGNNLYLTEFFNLGHLDSSIRIKGDKITRTTYSVDGRPNTFIKDYSTNGITKTLVEDTITYFNPDKSIRGRIVNGNYEGEWVYKLANGFVTRCHYTKNVIIGLVKTYSPQGVLWKTYECDSNGQKQGKELFFLDGDTLAAINYTDGEINGDCYSYYPKGQQFVKAKYVDSTLHELEIFSLSDSVLPVAQIQNGTGRIEVHLNNKKMSSIGIKNGFLDGPDTSFSDNIKPVITVYDNGHRLGKDSSQEDEQRYTFDFFPGEWIPQNTESFSTKAIFKTGPESLDEYIISNLVIPEIAYEEANSGVLYLQFIIDKNGELSDFKFITKKRIGFGVEEAYLDVMKSTSGKWEPASLHGEVRKMSFVKPLRLSFN